MILKITRHKPTIIVLCLWRPTYRPDLSRGRLIEEPESRHRTAFQRDRDRIIHSSPLDA